MKQNHHDKYSDRNFDEIADHFEHKIHNSAKGQLRRAVIDRDLQAQGLYDTEKPLDVLDLGAGMGYFTLALARQGHRLVYNDISKNMLAKCHAQAELDGLAETISWHCGSYQSMLAEHKGRGFDLVLCHALLEWLAEPECLLPALARLVNPGGTLSLCFYNPIGRVFRNLVCGNYNAINKQQPAGGRSLTPNNPCELGQVLIWLQSSGFEVKMCSGIRVFSDYAIEKRGGLNSDDDTMAMELEYSQQEPYWRMGRYIHILAQK